MKDLRIPNNPTESHKLLKKTEKFLWKTELSWRIPLDPGNRRKKSLNIPPNPTESPRKTQEGPNNPKKFYQIQQDQ